VIFNVLEVFVCIGNLIGNGYCNNINKWINIGRTRGACTLDFSSIHGTKLGKFTNRWPRYPTQRITHSTAFRPIGGSVRGIIIDCLQPVPIDHLRSALSGGLPRVRPMRALKLIISSQTMKERVLTPKRRTPHFLLTRQIIGWDWPLLTPVLRDFFYLFFICMFPLSVFVLRRLCTFFL